ncbi:ABC transporter permease [Actomonas aquatica]|uniref:ABC transporter permease n=1 Tax=Actomonas aquatica TaxID=2866162 RepID=A0ABZ1C539_9BACT|nr:ABC transporter permease [Opitutus sp. WL0086]WRQ86847.1 ABC transporter permease [Opitutus sp. WL0086]
MNVFTKLRQALRAVFRRNQLDAEMAEEMRFHREAQIEANLAAGMTRREALRAANLQFGPADAIAEEGREARGFAWLIHLRQDLRYGIKMLLKQKGFTFVAVMTLGLGLSANITIFSLVDVFFFQPLKVTAPERLVVMNRQNPSNQFASMFSWADYAAYRDQVPGLEDAMAVLLRPVHLAWPGQMPHRNWIENVSPNYLEALGARALLGRTFLPGEGEKPGADPYIVLNHRYWADQLGSDPGVVGRTVAINGHPMEVIGVTVPEFNGGQWGLGAAGWVPVTMMPTLFGWDESMFTNHEWSGFRVLAHLASGYDEARVEAEISVVDQRLRELHPSGDLDQTTTGVVREQLSRPDPNVSSFMPLAAVVFMALVLMILLIACANVSNLLSARAASRQRELGIRAAVGASRGRLTRQLLTESVLLALIAGAVGWFLSDLAGRLLSDMSPSGDMPVATEAVQGTWWILAFAVVVSLFAGVVTGLLPALRATRVDVQEILKSGGAAGGGKRRHWLRNGLVISQVAFCAIVLVAGGLFLRSLRQAAAMPLGFDPDNLAIASIDLDLQGYERERGRTFLRQLQDDLAAIPGVQAVALSNVLPMSNSPGLRDVSDANSPLIAETGQREGMLNAASNIVDEHFFDTLRINLLRGRGIQETDTVDSPAVVVVNDTLARRLWPEQDAIGQRLTSFDFTAEVVGVVATGKYVMISEEDRPAYYRPYQQAYNQPVTLYLRTAGDPAAALAEMRRVLQRLDPELPVYNTSTMEEHLRSTAFGYLPLRMAAYLAGAQGLVGLVLAVMGVYAVVAFSVSQRTREIGIRLALGADRSDVFRLVVRGGLILIGTGLGLGLMVALGLSHVLAGLLAGLNPLDVPVFGGVTLLLLMVSFLACYLPARRAMAIDPAITLKSD